MMDDVSVHKEPAGIPYGLKGFLAGVKILDLSQYIPGPMATLFLADMGAEVIKIEPPNGDAMQELGPVDGSGRPIYYRSLNAGKSVYRINLKDPAERDAFLELVRDVDVVVEGFRPGVMQRLGIDYERLCQFKSTIILCSISGYGAGTDLGRKAGHDANYLAMMGTLDRNGIDQPTFFDPPVSDIGGALFAAMTILGALHGRQRTGRGCEIDIALADTIMPMQMMQVAEYGAKGTTGGRRQTYLNGGAAYYQVYPVRDGRHVVIGAVEPKFWQAFCHAAGHPEWYARQSDPLPQNELLEEVSAMFLTMSVDEAVARFGKSDCCFSVVNDLSEVLNGTYIAERRLVRQDDHGNLHSLYPAWINGSPPQTRSGLMEYKANKRNDESERRPAEKHAGTAAGREMFHAPEEEDGGHRQRDIRARQWR